MKEDCHSNISTKKTQDGNLRGKTSFFLAKEFSLSEVPCRVVYDILAPTPKEYESLAIRFITRRCGVKFESLMEDQMAQLRVFLKTHTEGKVP